MRKLLAGFRFAFQDIRAADLPADSWAHLELAARKSKLVASP